MNATSNKRHPMKSASRYAKFFFAIILCGMFSLSCAQGSRYLQFVALVQGLINNAEFDISGTVTDMEGNALQDVTLELEFSRPADLWATKYDELHERKTVTGTFSVKKSRYTDVRMTFRKDGYYTEILDFSTPDDDEVAPVKMNNVQVKLRETGTFAEFIERVQGHIEYQIEKNAELFSVLLS